MKRLRIKTVIACILMGVILAAAGAVLVSRGISQSIADEQKDMHEALGSLTEPLQALENEWAGSEKWFNENIQNTMRFMQSLLEDLVSGDTYTGPRIFEDGMVIKLEDGEAEVPEGEANFRYPVLDQSFLEKLESGEDWMVMQDSEFEPDPSGEKEENAWSEMLTLCGIPLGGHYYYLNWTTEQEAIEYSDMHNRVADMLNETEIAFNGALFIFRTDDEEAPDSEGSNLMLSYPSAALPDITEESQELAVLKKAVQGGDTTVTIDEEQYILFRRTSEGRIMVFLKKYQPVFSAVLLRVVVVLCLLFLTAITLIVYLYYKQAEEIRDSGEEPNGPVYLQSRILYRLLAAGVVGAVLLTAASTFIHAVETLQEETLSGRATMEQLLEELKLHQEKTATATTKEEEDWYVYYGEQMAIIFAKHPKIATSEKLQELCDILSIDYIMLFNSKGKETLCNKDYSNFTLGTGQGAKGSTFRWLMQSVDAIVQPASYDETTNITRQYIGVSMPDVSNNVDPHGVLIMALMPDQTTRTFQDTSMAAQFSHLAVGGNEYFGVDAASGEIQFASRSEYAGGSIFQFGLSEKSLKGGYMGFARIDHQGFYVVTAQQNDTIYYCFMESSDMFYDLVSFALACLLCYVVLYVVLCLVMLHGFVKQSGFEDPETEEQEEEKLEVRKGIFRLRAGYKVPWREKDAREKAAAVFKIVLLVMIIVMFVYELANPVLREKAGNSLFRFIFFGDWMRGINLFSLCAILLLVIMLYIITTFVKWIFHSFRLLFGSRGETIGKLLSSFSSYVAILIVIYFSLEYLGLQPSTILAGLGIAGLAITMGAKDMITDIFAGVSIVFEGAFHVGDIIRIGQSQGTVHSIGIRMTRITESGGNIRIINNREIQDVVNLSRLSSFAVVTFKVPATASFEKIRKSMEENLPEIGRNNPDILSGPNYMGITGIDERTANYIITVSAECLEQKKHAVTNYLYESIVNLINQ